MPMNGKYPLLSGLAEELSSLRAEGLGRAPEAPAVPRVEPGRDLARVRWPVAGEERSYWLTGPQARVVGLLIDALVSSRSPDVDQGVLLQAARVPGARRLRDVFARSSAWGELVVPGDSPGSYRLPGLPPPPREGE